MCINIIPTAPWSPWGTRSSRTFTVFGAGPVDGLSKPEQRTCLPQGNEERGHLSRRPEAWNSETSTAQYIIYNKYWAVWNSRRLRKRLGSRALKFLFPSPASRTRMSTPLAIALEQRRARSNKLPRRNTTTTCDRAMGQDYPSTGPSPGTNPPIYPSSLPLACGNLLSNIFSKSHGFFSLALPSPHPPRRPYPTRSHIHTGPLVIGTSPSL